MTTEADRDRARLDTLLGEYLVRVPPRVNAGSYDLSVAFKAAIVAAKKTRAKRGVRVGELQSAVNNLHRFW